MSDLHCKIPDDLDRKLARAAKQRRVPKSAIVREAIAKELKNQASRRTPQASAWELSKDLCGSVDSGRGDLSTNKEYLKRMGREKYPY